MKSKLLSVSRLAVVTAAILASGHLYAQERLSVSNPGINQSSGNHLRGGRINDAQLQKKQHKNRLNKPGPLNTSDTNQNKIKDNSKTTSALGNHSDQPAIQNISGAISKLTLASTCLDTVSFTGLNFPVPDNNPLGATNSQNVSGISGNTLGLDVKLSQVCFSINHTWVGDLIVTLIAPNGTSIELINRPGFPATFSGCDGENIQMCIELGTGNEAENVCNTLPAISGTYTAYNNVNLNIINLAGGSPNGLWQLKVSDNAEFDTGNLEDWSLIFDGGPVANWTSSSPVCTSGPPVNLNTLITGTLGGTWSGQGVSGSTFNPAGLSDSAAVTYTVTDGNGCTDTQTNYITIINAPPTASFSSIPVSLTAYFSNNSAGGLSYSWDFGDGNFSTDLNPSHNYTVAGNYTVTLTASNACGSNSFSQLVSVVSCTDAVIDGSFENGAGSGAWNVFSSTFGTPVCDLPGCGNGSGTGPYAGDYWAWFGGVASFEESYVTQNITIPPNTTASLTFWIEQIICDSPADFLKVAINNDTIFSTTGASPLCGQLGYSLQSIDLSSYADGITRNLSFFSRSYGLNGNETNFFVDDIKLNVCIGVGISDIQFNNQITISPVPASDYLDIEFLYVDVSNVNVQFFDLSGKLVYEVLLPSINNTRKEKINIASLEQGVYIVKIDSGENRINRKIIKL